MACHPQEAPNLLVRADFAEVNDNGVNSTASVGTHATHKLRHVLDILPPAEREAVCARLYCSGAHLEG